MYTSMRKKNNVESLCMANYWIKHQACNYLRINCLSALQGLGLQSVSSSSFAIFFWIYSCLFFFFFVSSVHVLLTYHRSFFNHVVFVLISSDVFCHSLRILCTTQALFLHFLFRLLVCNILFLKKYFSILYALLVLFS